MKDSTMVRVSAILGLTILETVNLLITRIDGAILLTIGMIIGGLAGYDIGKARAKK